MIDLHGDLGASLEALLAQGPPEEVEAVLVAPDPRSDAYPALARFGSLRTVAVTPPVTTGAALALGIRAATAPVVAYCEDHVLPEPGWVAARLTAHREGATVVGSVLRNANPASAVSWAAFMQAFGPFVEPAAGGPSADLPWHQCSYLRDALPVGSELDMLLENEGLLHAELFRAGHKLVLESGSIACHINPSLLRSLVRFAWNGGRVWGAGRAAHDGWSRKSRLRHAMLAPHTFLRAVRLRLGDVQRVIPSRRRSVAPMLVLATAVHAAGEALGVLFGSNRSALALSDVELNRRAHLRASER